MLVAITPGMGSLLGGGLSALGSLFGASRSSSQARKARQQQMDQFNQMMDRSIQRRVADAKKAGIHPLAALGASPGAGPTITGGAGGHEGAAYAAAGEAVGRGIAGKALADAQLKNLQSSTELNAAQAAYWASEAARDAPTSPGTDGGQLDAQTYPYGTNPGPGFHTEAKQYVPEVPTSSRRGIRTGVEPLYVETVKPDGRIVQSFNPNLGLDEIGQAYVAYQLGRDAISDVFERVLPKRKDRQLEELYAYNDRLQRQMKLMRNNPSAYRRYIEVQGAVRRKIKQLLRR